MVVEDEERPRAGKDERYTNKETAIISKCMCLFTFELSSRRHPCLKVTKRACLASTETAARRFQACCVEILSVSPLQDNTKLYIFFVQAMPMVRILFFLVFSSFVPALYFFHQLFDHHSRERPL